MYNSMMKSFFRSLALCLLLAGSLPAVLSCGDASVVPLTPVNPDTPSKPDTPSTPDTPGDPASNVKSTIFKQNTDGHKIYRIPAIVRSAKGTLLCFAEGRTNGPDDNGDIDMVVKRSTDGGKTWGSLILIDDAGTDRYGNPVPIALGNGRIVLVYGWSVASSSMSSKVFVVFSDDDGLTWTGKKEITNQIIAQKQSIYMTGPVHGIVKQLAPAKGRLLVPLYGSGAGGSDCVIYSDDNGVNWTHGGWVPGGGGEPTVAERGDGSILLNTRNYKSSDSFRYQSVSADGGTTWGPATVTSLIEPGNGCQGALLTYELGSSAKDTKILFSNPSHSSSRRHGSVKLSLDGGLTWGRMFRYTADSTSDMYSSYSDLVLLGGTKIGVAYEAGYQNNLGILFRSFEYSEINKPYAYE